MVTPLDAERIALAQSAGQLMLTLRQRGCREFGLIGTSYGGWNGALLSFLEADFRFLALIQPIANVENAIWENPGSRSMRRILRAQGIEPGASDSDAVTSPLASRGSHSACCSSVPANAIACAARVVLMNGSGVR